MAIIQNWIPPTRENYETILFVWTLFPIAASLQWLIGWYGMGKTSVDSRLNIPGKLAWFTMEAPGFTLLMYTFYNLAEDVSELPWQNKVLAGLFVLHYLYRAVLYPIIQPSMSPIHILVWAFAAIFQITNATCLGSWLAIYGPTTAAEWTPYAWSTLQFAAGISIFYLGLVGNYIHDDELREIRRKEQLRQDKLRSEGRTGVGKLYRLPTAGLFRWILYPHYLLEWVEWFGFWMACGFTCVPASCFLLNEIAAMVPRTVRGRRWYVERFGEEKVGKKWTVIPGVL